MIVDEDYPDRKLTLFIDNSDSRRVNSRNEAIDREGHEYGSGGAAECLERVAVNLDWRFPADDQRKKLDPPNTPIQLGLIAGRRLDSCRGIQIFWNLAERLRNRFRDKPVDPLRLWKLQSLT